jgi:putative flippase GtrA
VLLTLPQRNADESVPRALAPITRHRMVLAQMVRFTAIGIVMTVAYLLLYAGLQGALGMQGANVVAWLTTAVADTSANRRLTFGVSGRPGAARAQLESLLVFGSGMAITSGALLAVAAVDADPSQPLQLGTLVAANIAAGLLRFTLLRVWVFAPRRSAREPHLGTHRSAVGVTAPADRRPSPWTGRWPRDRVRVPRRPRSTTPTVSSGRVGSSRRSPAGWGG